MIQDAVPLIRPMGSDDSLDELTDLLHRAYARLGDIGLNYTAVDQSIDVTRERVDGGYCLVAVVGDAVVGTVVVYGTLGSSACRYFSRAGVASFHQFAVDPAFQGKGIGRLLLSRCESWAMDSGFRELSLDTAETAIHLVAFYQGLGYREVDHVQWSGKSYRSVVMSKQLCSDVVEGMA